MLSAIYLGISGGRRKEKTVFLIAVSISILSLVFFNLYFPCFLILQQLVRFLWALPKHSTSSCSHFISHHVWFKVSYLSNILL